MNNDELDKLFKNHNYDFDFENPAPGHEARFLNKLKINAQSQKPLKRAWPKYRIPAIAASVLLCAGIFMLLNQRPEETDLKSVSVELSESQSFFASAITSELNKIKAMRSPENDLLISDALKQLAILEKDYERLKSDLKISGNDQRVIYAMINNYQNRIDILENVLKAIEEINEMKHQKNKPLIF